MMKTPAVFPPLAGLLFTGLFFTGLLFTGLLFGGALLTGCDKSDSKNTPQRSTTSSGNPATAPVDYLGAAAKAHSTATTKVSGTGLEQTIKLFYAQEGRFPKDLNELVRPDYLNAIPPPPAGMQYNYNPKDGELKVVPK